MTIQTVIQEAFQAQLETDASGVLWLRDGGGTRYQLAAEIEPGSGRLPG